MTNKITTVIISGLSLHESHTFKASTKAKIGGTNEYDDVCSMVYCISIMMLSLVHCTAY